MYPQNTLLAFQKAIDVKADYIELDVHFSADHEIVINHNYTTGSIADKNLIIKDTDLATLKLLNLPQGQKIPTLQEVFDLCKGKININIEIKINGIAEALNKLILKNHMENDVIISSFKHSELARMKKINPDLIYATLEPTNGYLKGIFTSIFSKETFIKRAESLGVNGIHPFAKFVNHRFCQRAHKSGKFINIWTSDNSKEWAKLINYGVDGICTNNPEKLYQFLSKFNSGD